jgi:hypothetical protein
MRSRLLAAVLTTCGMLSLAACGPDAPAEPPLDVAAHAAAVEGWRAN